MLRFCEAEQTASRCLLLGVAAIVMVGCDSNEGFASGEYSADGAKVRSITVDVYDRAVEVLPSDDDSVHISYFENDKEYYDILLSEDGELGITLQTDKDWTDYIGTKPSEEYRKITIEIPDGILQNLTIKTTNETIKLSFVSIEGGISLDNNGGNTLFENVGVGESLQAVAKNGNISGTLNGSISDFSVRCEIKKGDCNLTDKTDGEKSLYFNCNNGDIDIGFASAA